MHIRITFAAPLLAVCIALSGCDDAKQAATSAASRAQETSDVVSQAISEAKQELAKGNFKLSGEFGSLPKAEITPEGGLLIDGKPITLDATQQALLQNYRSELIAVAEAGMDIGAEGVDFAAKAAAESIRGVFSGNGEDVGARIEAEALKFKERALAICDHLPALLAVQRKVASAIPELAPYSDMKEKDIQECRSEQHDESAADEILIEA